MRTICRLAPIALLPLLCACASAPPRENKKKTALEDDRLAKREPPEHVVGIDDKNPEGMPFIKLAKREMALILYWRKPSPSPAYREELERLLARQIKTTYRAPLYVYRAEGSFTMLEPRTYLDLIEHKVDDAIVVEPGLAENGSKALGARVRVLSTTDEHAMVDLSLPEQQEGQGGTPPAPKFADRIWLALAKNWTDPGAHAGLDALKAADHLAERDACREAFSLYQKILPKLRPSSVFDAKRLDESSRKSEQCKASLALKEALEKDRVATFSISIRSNGVAPIFKEAFEGALKRSELPRLLEKLTSKPVVIDVAPGSLMLVMRYHPDRYLRATAHRDPLVKAHRAIYFEYWVEAMSALVSLRDAAADKLPSYDGPLLRQFNTTLRLAKLPDDHLDVDFGELDGRILFADQLRVKLGVRPEASVATIVPAILRDHIFVLGPSQEVTGELTNYGLIYKFLEIEQ
jgi:hypothetical protein